MFATFEGRVEKGRLYIDELGQGMKIFEGKHLAVSEMQINKANQIIGGRMIAGIYKDGELQTVSGEPIKEFEGKKVFVVVRHELIGHFGVFDQKFQLGAKLGDVDN
jgi:hypothetical protein